ncbi:Ankyrin repeats domain-containing protein [Phytophthora infestans]|uniref:Ankyrin repeats domain-containing protein n=1 Tax=Phytophthora infestans TaxID=4787 RepID=A0A8S9TKD9_PHYIN|nr:Ankyrin repeats domain-containing protein [Phytophthora infestans]
MRFIARYVVKNCLPLNDDGLLHVVRSISEFLTPFLCSEVFTAACEEGASRDTLDVLLQETTPVWKEAVQAAVRGGYLHVLRWMVAQGERGPWKDDFESALELAAAGGYLEVVQWLYERGIDRHTVRGVLKSPGYIEKSLLFDHCSSDALELAAEHGHLEVTKWIYSTSTDVCMQLGKPMDRAVANGHLAVAQWLYTISGQSCTCSIFAVDKAAKNGQLEMLQWLQSNHLVTCTTSAMDEAAKNGHLEVVKWLHRHRYEDCSSVALHFAANNGHLEVVKWLFENFKYYSWDQWYWSDAAERGHLEALRWLHEHLPSAFSIHVMGAAASNGHLDIIKWLHEHRREGCTTMAPFCAAAFGNLEIVQWFHAHYPDQFVPETIDAAAQNGHLDVVRWLNENRNEGCTGHAMDGAACNGHLDVVLYLMEHRGEGFPSSSGATPPNIVVQCSLRNSRQDQTSDASIVILQSIYKKRPTFVEDCLSCLAETAVRKGNIEILDWLNLLGVELRTSIPIRDTVSRGNVKMLQWFYANNFQMCDVDLLELAVQKGQLNTARWLSDHGFKITSILLEEAGKNGDVAMLRWLVEHGPPLTLRSALKLTLQYRHLEIAQWVSESARVQLVLEALQKDARKLIWWILTRTRFEDTNSQRRIRDAIRCAPSSILQWIQGDRSGLKACQWCFAASRNSTEVPVLVKRGVSN